MTNMSEYSTNEVVGLPITALTFSGVLSQIRYWERSRESRYICICNVHSAYTASIDADFRAAVAGADLNTPDGAPLVALLRWLGKNPKQQRITGPELMWEYLSNMTSETQRVFLYGGSEHSLARLCERIRQTFPVANIVGHYSPPFRPMTPSEEVDVIRMINACDATVVFVGLGCPKQEIWMRSVRGSVKAVMIGVGAAFDFHSGLVPRAPALLRRFGLEWFYRLVQEPRRLWRRYLTSNTWFLWVVIIQILKKILPIKS